MNNMEFKVLSERTIKNTRDRVRSSPRSHEDSEKITCLKMCLTAEIRSSGQCILQKYRIPKNAYLSELSKIPQNCASEQAQPNSSSIACLNAKFENLHHHIESFYVRTWPAGVDNRLAVFFVKNDTPSVTAFALRLSLRGKTFEKL